MKLLLLVDEFDFSDAWRSAFKRFAPSVELVESHESGHDVEGALVYQAEPTGRLSGLPRLKIIFALAAGVDAILCDPLLPRVPIVPLANDELAALMREYVVYHCIGMHRRFHELPVLQREKRWVWMPPMDSAYSRRVTVLGLGRLGLPAAQALSALGFNVAGWSRTQRAHAGIRCFSGADGLAALLPDTDIAVCVLPLTAETRGMLAADFFDRLPRGAGLINAGRGECLDESDLLAALDSGQVSHATLDVFSVEPLPPGHALWTHPLVTVTPHVAANASPESCVRAIATNLARLERGEPPTPIVNWQSGY